MVDVTPVFFLYVGPLLSSKGPKKIRSNIHTTAYLHLPVRVLKKNPKKNVVFWHPKIIHSFFPLEDAGVDFLNLFDVVFVFGGFLRFSSKRSLFVNFGWPRANCVEGSIAPPSS